MTYGKIPGAGLARNIFSHTLERMFILFHAFGPFLHPNYRMNIRSVLMVINPI